MMSKKIELSREDYRTIRFKFKPRNDWGLTDSLDIYFHKWHKIQQQLWQTIFSNKE